MTRSELESNVRLAVLACNVTLEMADKTTAVIMEVVDQYTYNETHVTCQCPNCEQVALDVLRTDVANGETPLCGNCNVYLEPISE